MKISMKKHDADRTRQARPLDRRSGFDFLLKLKPPDRTASRQSPACARVRRQLHPPGPAKRTFLEYSGVLPHRIGKCAACQHVEADFVNCLLKSWVFGLHPTACRHSMIDIPDRTSVASGGTHYDELLQLDLFRLERSLPILALTSRLVHGAS